MIARAKIAILLLANGLRCVMLSLRPGRSLIAENFFLRRQLALYKGRGIKPWRIDPATRVSLRLIELLRTTALYREGGGQGN